MLIIYLHLFAVLLLAALRFWIHHIDRHSPRGSDLHMLRYCRRHNTRAYALYHIAFDQADGLTFSEIREQVVQNVGAHIRKPHSSFRRGVDVEKQRYFFKSELAIMDLVEDVENDNDFFRVNDPGKRELILRFHHGRNLFGMLFDHTAWDGIRIVNECLVHAIHCKAFDSKWLIRPPYLPGVAEALQIATVYCMAARRITHRPMAVYDNAEEQQVVKHHWRTHDIKALKSRLTVSFTAGILAAFGERLFEAAEPRRNRIRFGVIIGCQNPRFRNNYTIATVDLKRGHSIEDKARSAQRQLAHRKFEILSLYHLMNAVEVQTAFKRQMVDVLFSPAFFDRDHGLSLRVNDMSFFNIPCSTPVYSFACSIDEVITLSTTLNSPDVNARQFARDSVSVFQSRSGPSLVDISTDYYN